MPKTVLDAVDSGMVAFDTETTGTNPETARIVTATVVQVEGTQTRRWSWLINPEVPIPDEAAAVHGITTETAQAQGAARDKALPELAGTLLDHIIFTGYPLVIMNAAYDLTVFDREMRRIGRDRDTQDLACLLVIDPMVIDRAVDKWRRGKRTLTDLCAHYKVPLEGAHDAAEDALAAARLAWRLARVFPEQVGQLELAQLHDQQCVWREAWAAEFITYLKSQGKDASDVDGSWPLRPWRGADADHS